MQFLPFFVFYFSNELRCKIFSKKKIRNFSVWYVGFRKKDINVWYSMNNTSEQ